MYTVTIRKGDHTGTVIYTAAYPSLDAIQKDRASLAPLMAPQGEGTYMYIADGSTSVMYKQYVVGKGWTGHTY